MVKGIGDDATRLALMMAGIDPDSFDDVTQVDEGEWCDEVTGEFELPEGTSMPAPPPRFGAEAPDPVDYIRRIIGAEHGGDPLPSTHRFTALVDMKDVWQEELRAGLKETTMRLASGVTYAALTNGGADEAFGDADAFGIAEIIMRSDDLRMRMLAVISAAEFAPPDGELVSPAEGNALYQILQSLIGILINIDEPPLLRQAAVYAYTTLMSSSLRHMFGYLKIETGSGALFMIASNDENPAHLREAAVSGLGILSETWIWRIPVALEMDGLLTGIVARENAPSFRLAAMRAYGMAFANTFVDDPRPMIGELKAILANKEVAALKKTARSLIDAIRASDPQFLDDVDDDGSSSPATGGASNVPEGAPPSSTPPTGGQGALGMMRGAATFMSSMGASAVLPTAFMAASKY